MIETIIYWTGALAIISVLGVISAIATMVLPIVTSYLAEEIKSTYDHNQLRRLMNKLKKNGFDETYKSEIEGGENGK